jgi:16S rRNA (cytidine1402-2'-O)-methyltransferase
MKSATLLGKPTLNDGCFQTVKRTIDFIDYYIVENEKTARKSIKEHPEKKQSELVLLF